jgi:hypothetical protein
MNIAEVLSPQTTSITPPPARKVDAPKQPDPYAIAPSDMLCEVVNNVRVEKEIGAFEQVLGGLLHGFLVQHCAGKDLGHPLVETTLAIPSRGNDRRPDVAFVSYARWPKNRPVPRVNAWPVVPELVVEVISLTDELFKVIDKADEYFESGVRLVWLILSNVERVYVLTSPTQWTVLNRTDELTGGDVVPGFKLQLTELFPVYLEEDGK